MPDGRRIEETLRAPLAALEELIRAPAEALKEGVQQLNQTAQRSGNSPRSIGRHIYALRAYFAFKGLDLHPDGPRGPTEEAAQEVPRLPLWGPV